MYYMIQYNLLQMIVFYFYLMKLYMHKTLAWLLDLFIS